jgi:hypothetical protein
LWGRCWRGWGLMLGRKGRRIREKESLRIDRAIELRM